MGTRPGGISGNRQVRDIVALMSDDHALEGSVAVLKEDPALAGGILCIDLQALAENWRAIARANPGVEAAAVVKADAYGLGMAPVAKALAKAGCRTFFVALPQEGAALKGMLPAARVFVLSGLPRGEAGFFQRHGLVPVLNSTGEVEEWADFCRQSEVRLPAAVHVDTGMNRLGLRPEEALRLTERGDLLCRFRPELLMSHLACADEPGHEMNALQKRAFDEVRALFPGVPASLANSAASLAWPEWRYDLLRPGIALYGGNPFADRPNPMRTVVTLYGTILQVREVRRGETVGYGATWRAPRDSRIAILGLGYADGLFRAISGSAGGPAHVYVAGQFAPYAGRISMDLAAVDVSHIPPEGLARGQRAEVMGPHVSVDELARWAGTIPYEILTSLGARFTRLYTPTGD